jgi:hypothetical protein
VANIDTQPVTVSLEHRDAEVGFRRKKLISGSGFSLSYFSINLVAPLMAPLIIASDM